VRISCGGCDGGVSEEDLNDAEVGPGLQEVRGKGMT